VSRCLHCSLVFGDPAPAADPGSAPTQVEGHCCLCGRGFDRLKEEKPGVVLKVWVAITNALRCNDCDEKAFLVLQESAPEIMDQFEEHLLAYHQAVIRPAVRKVLAPRLARLRELWRREFGCRHDGREGDPCGGC
jgi:hypothetical protein